MILPGHELPLNDPQEIRELLENQVAGIIDAGPCPLEPTTVLDLTTMDNNGSPTVAREGRGDLAVLGM